MLHIEERPRLQIVKRRSERRPCVPTQAALFPSAQKPQLMFASLPGVSDQDFLALVASARPAVVVDLRRAPRFSVGCLNRRAVLECFARNNAVYLDGMAISDCSVKEDGDPDVGTLLAALRTAIPDVASGDKGPILFLTMQSSHHADLLNAITAEWYRQTSANWDVYEVR
jgi:hypothetical protein